MWFEFSSTVEESMKKQNLSRRLEFGFALIFPPACLLMLFCHTFHQPDTRSQLCMHRACVCMLRAEVGGRGDVAQSIFLVGRSNFLRATTGEGVFGRGPIALTAARGWL